MVSQLKMPTYTLAGRLIQADAQYRVEVLDRDADGETVPMKQASFWVEYGCEASGEWLMEIGLELPIMNPETTMLFSFTKL